jgi:prevent-host-death family protein
MESIGIRQLQQNAAATVERVRQGATITVTVRGHAVARLVPIRGTILDQLEAAGHLTRATRSFKDLPPPRKPKPGVEVPSVTLAKLRADER